MDAITTDTKKRSAESTGGQPDPKRPLQQLCDDVLGLGTERDLQTKALELWESFETKKDPRIVELNDFMENGAPFVPGPIIDNTVELLKFVQKNNVGAIVSGHIMAGKTQTPQFVEHFLKGCNCGVLKFSLTDTNGPDMLQYRPPYTSFCDP